jgi:hypothetical protein
MNRSLLIIIACAVLVAGSGPPSAPAQSSTNFKIKKSAGDMAGPASSSTNFKIKNAVGQAGSAGVSSSSGYVLGSGFFALSQNTPPQFTIVVDGNKDSFYGTLAGPNDGCLQLRSYAWNENGVPDNDADLSAKVWTAWDSQWLYIYEEVKDNTLAGNATNVWEEDCFEIQVDPQATSAANSIWSTRLTALTTSTAGVVADDDMDNVSGSDKQYARKTITGGYALELAVKWSAISSGSETINPAAGTLFGSVIQQHDNDGNAARSATVQWAAVFSDASWNTPSCLGTVKLLADHKLQFIAKNNITNVTNPVPYDGSDYTRTGVEEEETIGPVSFGLEQNHPNPFNPSTKISFRVAESSEVNIEIFDLLGRSIRTLGNMQYAPGSHVVEWDGLDDSGQSAASGVYLIVLSDGSRSLTKKMIKME